MIAEYKVACGVAPPGLDHNPCVAIASTIAMQFIGSLLAARTCAAASSAETRFGFGSLTFVVRAGFVSVVGAAGAAPLAIAALASVASFFVSNGPYSWPPSFGTTQNLPLASFLTCRSLLVSAASVSAGAKG